MHYRQPTRRRGAHGAAVDYEHLVDLVRRRCLGCDPAVHREVARQFLAAQHYDVDDQQKVLELLEDLLSRPGRPRGWRRADGGTLCSTCGHRFYDHEPDKEAKWLTVLCNGDRVKLA